MNNGTGQETRRAPVLTTTEARQGVTPRVTRYVPGWGLLPIVESFALVYFQHL